MSFNIHHGVGLDNRLDLERVAQTIEAQGIDVAGLQEVDRHYSDRSNFEDQARWLAHRLHMHGVYGVNLDLDPFEPGAPRRQYGTAMLSRYPIGDWSNTHLPKGPKSEQRGLLYARIRVHGTPVQLYNTHLQFDSQADRLAQITKIQELIGLPEESVVLVGDLNATPDTPEIAEITKNLVDAWSQAGVGTGSTTNDPKNPDRRIDYVLTSSGVVARTVAVVNSDASDHLPVVAELALPGTKIAISLRLPASNINLGI